MNTPTPFEEIVNKYPLNTFSGETKKELLVLLAAVHDSALEKATEAVEGYLILPELHLEDCRYKKEAVYLRQHRTMCQ